MSRVLLRVHKGREPLGKEKSQAQGTLGEACESSSCRETLDS